MKASSFIVSCSLVMLWMLLPGSSIQNSGVSSGSQAADRPAGTTPQSTAAQKPASAVKSGSRNGAHALLEKEAALNLKEQELKRVSATLDTRMKELEEARRSVEETITVKKKVDDERYKKMLKLYKALRPEEAAKLIDKLDEDIALEMLNQMDTKTAAKLIPFLNEKRVLKWTRKSLVND